MALLLHSMHAYILHTIETNKNFLYIFRKEPPLCWLIGISIFPAYIVQGEIYYRKTSNISRTLVGNKTVDNSDVVGASPVGAAPTTSSFST